MTYNASDRKQIREAKRMQRLSERARQATISALMSNNLGRQYIYELLCRCHMFSPSFNTNALTMAFSEGERNVGLTLLSDIMAVCPDQYINLQREANDRSITADARSSAGESDTDSSADSDDSPSPGHASSEAGY